MRFAGDSAICAFLATAEEAEYKDKGLAAATQRAVRCAAVLANDLGAPPPPVHGCVQQVLPRSETCLKPAAPAGKGWVMTHPGRTV